MKFWESYDGSGGLYQHQSEMMGNGKIQEIKYDLSYYIPQTTQKKWLVCC